MLVSASRKPVILLLWCLPREDLEADAWVNVSYDYDLAGDGYLISQLTDMLWKHFGLDWLLGGGMMTGRFE